MSKIIVIGSGMVGSAMSLDLAAVHEVTATDFNETALASLRAKNPEINTIQLDVTNREQLSSVVAGYELAICAVPGFLGFETLRTVIETGVNLVDISFAPENMLELDAFARKNKVTAIVDCGVAPGMGNFIAGYHNESMHLKSFECLVGGLPKVKKWPFYYKAPFSPIDVIEEYTRPARYRENGVLVTRKALSDCEYVSFDQVGTLESFNTDGLRSLLYTLPDVPDMKEKTLRYPGHVEIIKALQASGFFSTDKITVNGTETTPLDFTSRILINEWKLAEGEPELTVMRITLKGTDKKSGKEQTIIYHLYDEYNAATGITSMARTTGYTATAAANLILNGLFTDQGVFPPESVGKNDKCFEFVVNYLLERGVSYSRTQNA